MGLLHSNLSFPVLIKILEKPPSPARPRIRAVRNSIPMCVSAAYFSLFGWKSLTLAHEHPMGRKCSPGLQSLKAPVFLFISASTKLYLLCQLIFFLNRPSLLVYRHDGTYCLNPGFIISTYVKPKIFGQEVLVGSGDACTLPGNTERGKEYYGRQKWSHPHQNGQVLWRSALMCISHFHKMTLTSSGLILSYRW